MAGGGRRPEELLAPACCILPLLFLLIICIYFEKCISCFVQIMVIKHPYYRGDEKKESLQKVSIHCSRAQQPEKSISVPCVFLLRVSVCPSASLTVQLVSVSTVGRTFPHVTDVFWKV